MGGPDGLLLVDKPAGLTSHDVVARVRRAAGTRRVGHAGTLDPMATGLLVLGLGRGTKLLTFLVGADKDYDATIRLGQATITDDAEGEVTRAPGASGLDRARVAEAVAGLTGEIEQVPSAVSAIKVKGVRSYARVRGGEAVDLPARPVTVSRFDVLAERAVSVPGGPTGPLECLDLDVRVTVSSGTYVRALARDLGDALGSGGHLTALRRTRVGGLGVTEAVTLETAQDSWDAQAMLTPLAVAARRALHVREVTEAQARTLGFGQRIESSPGRHPVVAAIAPGERLVAVLDESGPLARAHVVLAPAEPNRPPRDL